MTNPLDVTIPHVDVQRKQTETMALFLIAALAAFMKLVSGFGKGITFQVCYWFLAAIGILIAPSAPQATMLIYCAIVPVSWLKVRSVLEHCHLRFTGILWMSKIIGSIIGSFVLVTYANVWIERGLGIFFLLLLAINLYIGYTNTTPPEHGRSGDEVFEVVSIPAFLFLGIISGILSGMFGIGGPPMMAFGLYYDVDRKLLATSTLFSLCFGNGPVTIIYLGIIHKQINSLTYPYVLAVFGGGLVGFSLGQVAARYTSQKSFRWMLRVLLLCGSVIIGTHGLGEISRITSYTCGVVLIGTLTFVLGNSVLSREKNSQASFSEDCAPGDIESVSK